MQGPQASRHVIFDLDGTLLDSEPLYTVAAQQVVGRFGKTYTWEIKRQVMGGDARKSAAFVIEQLDLPLTVDEYLTERNRTLETLFRDVPAMPGAEQLVRNLHASGRKLAIATSSERRLCELKLARHGWAELFEVIVCKDDPGAGRAKPAPDLFLHAARGLGAEPSGCLAFEDAPQGVAAALAAQMQVIALVDPHMDVAAYEGCHRIIRSFEELDPAALP